MVAGCDGFHGVCRDAVPAAARQVFERDYPFAWLGVLAAVAPSSEEIVYAASDRGFALHSMRSPELTRLYLQVDPDEPVERWPDGRIWEELQARLATDDGWTLDEGEILDKGVTGMRSFVVEPMRFWAAVPGRRRRPHRAADRRQGHEPGRGRRPRARRGAGRLVPDRRHRPARRLVADLPAPGLRARTSPPG